MSDLSNNEKNTTGIEDKSTGYDLKVNSDGSINVVSTTTITSPPTSNVISLLVAQGKVFSAAAAINAASAGVNNPLLLIKNPTGSGKTIFLYRGSFGIDIENNFINYRFYASPTITANGTAVTPVNNLIGSATGSSMNIYSLPTTSSLGTIFQTYEVASNGNSIQTLDDFSIHIPEGKMMLITGDPKSNNRLAILTICWAEY